MEVAVLITGAMENVPYSDIVQGVLYDASQVNWKNDILTQLSRK